MRDRRARAGLPALRLPDHRPWRAAQRHHLLLRPLRQARGGDGLARPRLTRDQIAQCWRTDLTTAMMLVCTTPSTLATCLSPVRSVRADDGYHLRIGDALDGGDLL